MAAAHPRYMLDANICIRMMRNPDGRVARRVRGQAEGAVAMSAIVCAEVVRGATRAGSEALATLQVLLAAVPVLAFDAAAARVFPRAAKARGGFDRLIAAHALSLDATLITCNTRDFRDVPGLRIEDWTL
jgi:tRNA(fMet)-specific endonuclease VapC